MPVDKYEIDGARLRDRYPVGVISHVERPPYSDVYADARSRRQGRRRWLRRRWSRAWTRGRRLRAPNAWRCASRARADRASCSPRRCSPTPSPRWAREVVQTQSYGPEARGGASQAEVIASTEPIDYPEVDLADVSLCLSQPAFDKYAHLTRPGGLVLYDSGLVEESEMPELRLVGLPFTDTAKSDLGAKVVTNIVSLGAPLRVRHVAAARGRRRRGRARGSRRSSET